MFLCGQFGKKNNCSGVCCFITTTTHFQHPVRLCFERKIK